MSTEPDGGSSPPPQAGPLELTVTLTGDEAAAFRATLKGGRGIQAHAKSILLSSASKHRMRAEQVKANVVDGKPAKPRIRPELAATIGRLNAADWIRGELANASDRAAGVLGGAFVDDALTDLLKAYWKRWGPHPYSDAVECKVFKYPGPLSSFSGRIGVARMSGVIGPQTHGDLDNIREIRNACAHWKMSRESDGFVPVSFEEQEINGWCDALLFAKDCEMDFVGGEQVKPKNGRDKFILAVSLLGQQLVNCTVGVIAGMLLQEDVHELLP